MKRRTELYNLVIEEQKTIENLTELNELQSDTILNEFLTHYYEQFNCNLDDTTENTILEEDVITEDILTDSEEFDSTNAIDIEDTVNDTIEDEIDLEQINTKKIDLKGKSICYYIKSIEDVEYIDENVEQTRNVLINYIKYDKKVNIVDKNTLRKIFTKDKTQGDLEKQHYIIRTFSNSNRALIVWEKVYGAVTISLLEKHINSNFRKWVKDTYKDDSEKKFYLLKYNIKIYAVPSKNFIEEIERMDKISLLNVTVKKEKLTTDEDILYSEENIARDYVDLIYKPVKGKCFSKPRVIRYFEGFNNNNNIKRLVIKGRRQGSSVSLDTDLMKMSEHIDIRLNDDGLVNSDDLFIKYNNLMNSYYEAMSENAMDLELCEEEC